VDTKNSDTYRVTLAAASNEVLNVSDDTARYKDAKVSRWDYTDGSVKTPVAVDSTDIYTHDDNTLVHDFFYIVNDDRNDGGDGMCGDTPRDTRSTPNAYGTTTSTEYVRPTRRGDRDFSLWQPGAPRGSFGEAHIYFWARKYVLWQKQALVDEGVLTLGNFNNYTKALVIANACADGNGKNRWTPLVSTLDDVGENLRQIVFPDRCRTGTPAFGLGNDCGPTDYEAIDSTTQFTFDGTAGYHTPGVIDHEFNHFLIQDYFDVPNSLDCTIHNEAQYFQEGGLGRTLPQMFWHHYYGVGYMPLKDGKLDTDKLFQSGATSGKPHDPADAGTLNELSGFACGALDSNSYDWGGVVSQPMWEIYHGQKVDGTTLVSMDRPATDTEMIRAMYYAADMATATSFSERADLANRFMEWWYLFGSLSSTGRSDWCGAWQHHGLDTFINVTYCS